MPCRLVTHYWGFRIFLTSHLQGSSSTVFWTTCPWNMGLISCNKTLITNHESCCITSQKSKHLQWKPEILYVKLCVFDYYVTPTFSDDELGGGNSCHSVEPSIPLGIEGIKKLVLYSGKYDVHTQIYICNFILHRQSRDCKLFIQPQLSAQLI